MKKGEDGWHESESKCLSQNDYESIIKSRSDKAGCHREKKEIFLSMPHHFTVAEFVGSVGVVVALALLTSGQKNISSVCVQPTSYWQ